MSLLCLPYPRSSPYSPVYITFRSQIHCNSVQHCFARVVTRTTRFYSLSAASEIIALAPYALCIIFKICAMIYLSSTYQVYQNTMLALTRNSLQLRSFSSKPPLHSSGENESGNPSFLCCCTNSVEFAFCQC